MVNSEIVFHEILLLQGAAALGDQLEVHLPLFMYNKIKFLYNKKK